jgi:hypothetical protein
MGEYLAAPRVMDAMAQQKEKGCPACCNKGKENCPRQAKDCAPVNDCCFNCPLCYTMVLPASLESVTIERAPLEYSIWTTAYIYLYHSSCWKPPNVA